MRTLVYFASGPNRKEYQNLNFDKIYLIDNCFKNQRRYKKSIFSIGKVTCIGMDCLEAVSFLKKHRIKIDCFVSLNEGLYEGGGSYAINSDMFLGFVMPLLRDNYIHIMNKNYYCNNYNVSMDLPYDMEEITYNDNNLLSPFMFSKENYHKGHAKVFQMTKIQNIETITINPMIKLSILHDSIWNYYDELDNIILSFSDQAQNSFFDTIPKVIKHHNLTEIMTEHKANKVQRIGLTPWTGGCYSEFIRNLRQNKTEHPKEIILFHLNKDDYQDIRYLVN